MSYTLFQATLDLARILDDVYEGSTTTTGATTSLTDSRIPTDAAVFPGGTLWMPERTVASVVQAAQSTRVASQTVATILAFDALTASIATAQGYQVTGPRFPKYALIQAINMALQAIGKVVNRVEVTADGSQEYTNSLSAYIDEEILEIWIGNSTDPNDWMPHLRWRQIPVDNGRKLVFVEGSEPDSGDLMHISYKAEHATVSLDASVISPQINPEKLKWAAAAHALRWRKQRTKADEEPTLDLMLKEAQANAALYGSRYPIKDTPSTRVGSW